MNERIRLLSEQARHWAHFDGLEQNPKSSPDVLFEQKFAELIIEECAREVEEFARKWWSIHCHSNKHAETTRKAHDDFCSLQAAIRRRGKTE
jgi:hypothetical protein